MQKQEFSKLFIIIGAINITCLMVANIIAIKTVSIFGFVVTVANLIFPLTYVLNNIFTEVYGLKKAKLIIWLSFSCNLIMVIFFFITIKIPVSDTFSYQKELETVLGFTPRLLAGSFLAYLAGSFVNANVLTKLKEKTKGKYLPFRTITSNIIGSGLDSLIFVPVAFFGIVDLSVLVTMIVSIFLLKIVYEIVLTPVAYYVIKWVKKVED